MSAPATNEQIKEIFARNADFPRITGRRKKTVGLAQVYLDELDALLERIRSAEAERDRLTADNARLRDLVTEWRRRVKAIGRDVGSYRQCADELEAALAGKE